MRDFHTHIEIAAPPDRVWSIMRDVDRWPEWTPTVSRIRRLDPGPLAVGHRAVIYQPKLLPARWKVTEFDDHNRSFTWITRGPAMLITARHSVQAKDDNTSRATLSLQFTGLLAPLVARLLEDLNNRYLAIEAKGLKQRSEA
jgi:carbon monoxide dehydrogenase subunit G